MEVVFVKFEVVFDYFVASELAEAGWRSVGKSGFLLILFENLIKPHYILRVIISFSLTNQIILLHNPIKTLLSKEIRPWLHRTQHHSSFLTFLSILEIVALFLLLKELPIVKGRPVYHLSLFFLPLKTLIRPLNLLKLQLPGAQRLVFADNYSSLL